MNVCTTGSKNVPWMTSDLSHKNSVKILRLKMSSEFPAK